MALLINKTRREYVIFSVDELQFKRVVNLFNKLEWIMDDDDIMMSYDLENLNDRDINGFDVNNGDMWPFGEDPDGNDDDNENYVDIDGVTSETIFRVNADNDDEDLPISDLYMAFIKELKDRTAAKPNAKIEVPEMVRIFRKLRDDMCNAKKKRSDAKRPKLDA